MDWRRRILALAAAAVWGATATVRAADAQPPAAAAGQDLHDYWDQRCKDCHGHAAEFARRFLRLNGALLQGVHHRDDLALFLRQHYLTDTLVAPVSAMLAAQLTSPALFREHCARCHDSAAAFARQSLEMRQGALTGRHSGTAVSDYLGRHGGLAPAQVPLMLDELTRVFHEVSGSAATR